MIRRLIIAVLSGALLSAAPLTDRAESTARAAAFATDPDAVERHLAVWDLSAARSAAAALPEGPLRDFKAGAVAFYEAEYTRAEAQLARALASEELDDDDAEEAQHLLDLTRGARRALGEPTVLRSPDGKVELVLASPKDALIAPYLFEAMAAARDALGGTLGVWPDHPVRFEILDAPEKLALVTPLTRENVYTTGTVGVTKYRRIMMLTPRIMPLGYPWIDTAVHEYVHYLLTLRTRNNAPVWVQEGLAKLLEERWRRPDPSPLAPPSARLLRDAIRKDELVTLDQMYPSVAMLPSQEQAALAYAEVQTMLGFLLERRGGRGLGVLLDEISRGTDAREAMAIAWGEPFDQFHAEWLTYARKEATARAARDPGKPL
ncbi:MAG: hypothetical protein KC636_18745, partial [Myxococcales bacterium]|nr:hypothetical protein [Myxococcales bacterium]